MQVPQIPRILLAAISLVSFAQSPIRVPGVDEPPELTGEPKQVTTPPEALRELADVFPTNEKDADKAKIGIEKLTKVLRENPDYSDGYFMRAMFNRCMLNSNDTESVLRDIDTAISTHSAQRFPGVYKSLADHYSLRAKVEFDTGQHREALDDLEKAVRQKIDDADSVFGSGGTQPGAVSPNNCIWSLSDVDRLSREFPKDYRGVLFRGLYYRFFMRFNVKYFRTAIDNVRGAIAINPRSALAYYLLGRTYSQAVLWSSLIGIPPEQSYKSAIQANDRAVELDPKLTPAFLERANARYQLKHYQEAIKDFDRVLELDPENSGAYHDRGLAKFNLEEYRPASFDFGEAIRLRTPDDLNLWAMYENRADCYIKMGEYRNAIADLTKAIELQLRDQGFLFTLRQFRALYPEYDGVPDAALCRKFNLLFWPQFKYDVIAKQLLEKKDEWAIAFLQELYEKRGDAYLTTNDFRRGVLDFNRIFKGIPNFADGVDRWRLLGSSRGGEEHYIDVKTVEFSGTSPARLWLKTVNKNETYTVQSYEIDCKGRRLNVTSTVLYSRNDEVVNSSETSSEWQRIVPETRGEQLYSGMCSGVR
jgi:tetratricopeptide (TPR) repeat protein